jgi:hypothetical protein
VNVEKVCINESSEENGKQIGENLTAKYFDKNSCNQ